MSDEYQYKIAFSEHKDYCVLHCHNYEISDDIMEFMNELLLIYTEHSIMFAFCKGLNVIVVRNPIDPSEAQKLFDNVIDLNIPDKYYYFKFNVLDPDFDDLDCESELDIERKELRVNNDRREMLRKRFRIYINIHKHIHEKHILHLDF